MENKTKTYILRVLVQAGTLCPLPISLTTPLIFAGRGGGGGGRRVWGRKGFNSAAVACMCPLPIKLTHYHSDLTGDLGVGDSILLLYAFVLFLLVSLVTLLTAGGIWGGVSGVGGGGGGAEDSVLLPLRAFVPCLWNPDRESRAWGEGGGEMRGRWLRFSTVSLHGFYSVPSWRSC